MILSSLSKNAYLAVALMFSCVTAKSQPYEVDKYRSCKLEYEKINKYILSLEEFKRDIYPLSSVKNEYLSRLRFKALSGSLEERKDASRSYYGDSDYESFNLNLIVGLALSDLREFIGNRGWVKDRENLLSLIHKDEKFNFYSADNPFKFIEKEIELSRNMSMFVDEMNRNLLELKAKNQSYKVRNLDYYLATSNNGHWPVSNLLDCHIRYFGEAWQNYSTGIDKIKK